MFGTNKLEKVTFLLKGESSLPENQSARLGLSLAVNSIFYTIQGEGPYAGRPAVFVRLSGCNLACHFCDTEFEETEDMPIEEIVGMVKQLDAGHCNLVVLTGGEPMRQQIIPLLVALCDAEYYVQIETAGTVWPNPVAVGDNNHSMNPTAMETVLRSMGPVSIVCSPKTGKVHPMIEKHCRHFKYILRHGEVSALDGLPAVSTQVSGQKLTLYRPPQNRFNLLTPAIWVQPCAEYMPDSTIERPIDHPAATRRNTELCVAVAKLYGYRVSMQMHKILDIP